MSAVQQHQAITSAGVSTDRVTDGVQPLQVNAGLHGKFVLLIAIVMGAGLLVGYLCTRNHRTDTQGYLGISVEPPSAEQARSLGSDQGLVITKVFQRSTAESAGIRPGDLIIRVDDDPVTSPRKFNSIRSEWKPNQTVTLHVLREGSDGPQEVAIEVPLMTYDQVNQLAGQTP
jgi:hypothetical protein